MKKRARGLSVAGLVLLTLHTRVSIGIINTHKYHGERLLT